MRVVRFQRLIELEQGLAFEQFITRHRQLAAQIKELVLNINQQLAHILRHGLTQQHAQVRIQFIDIAHRANALAGFGDAGVVSQPGCAIVSGTCGDLGESVAHGVLVKVKMLLSQQ